MSSYTVEAELVHLEEQFGSSAKPTKIQTPYIEGSISEKRFLAGIALHEQLQERLNTSNKTVTNIYRFVVNRVLKQYGLPKEDEPQLRQKLLSLWDQAPPHVVDELEGFELNKQIIRENNSRSVLGQAFQEQDQYPYPYQDVERPEVDVPQYRFTREAGMR